MIFFVFFLILAFLTLFVAVSVQIRSMATLGKPAIGHVPTFLAKRLSTNAYVWLCRSMAWIIVMAAGLIYNSDAKDPGGPFWSAAYLFVLTALYAFFWIRNRHVELKP